MNILKLTITTLLIILATATNAQDTTWNESIDIIKKYKSNILFGSSNKTEDELEYTVSDNGKIIYDYVYKNDSDGYRTTKYTIELKHLKDVLTTYNKWINKSHKLMFDGDYVLIEKFVGPQSRRLLRNTVNKNFIWIGFTSDTNLETKKLIIKSLQNLANRSASSESAGLDKTLVPSNELAAWVDSYGLQKLISKAEGGNPIAQRRLGRYYRFVSKDDEEAVQWYEQAANQLDFIALGNLAYHLENGYGVEVDKEEAAICLAFKNAVAPYGQSRINGIRGLIGLENARNLIMEVLVEELLRNGDLFKITNDKDVIANVYYNVAEFFETGVASKYPKDISKAIAFYKLSSDYGNRHAKKKLSELD